MPGPFTFYPDIPQASDQISQSQQDLLSNFDSINKLIEVDHATFASADAGKHNKVTMPVQSPEPSFNAGEIGVYNFLSPTTSDNQLYFTNNANVKRPLTVAKGLLSTQGWTLLPANVFLGWGIGSFGATGDKTIAWVADLGFPAMSTINSLTVTSVGSVTTTFVKLKSFNTTNFVINTNATPSQYTFMVIGTVVNSSIL